MRAKFVTFEGIEGSGKSTQVRALEAHYSGKGLRVLTTREPGGTVLGNEIRPLLVRSRTEPLDAAAELFLLEAARAQLVARILTQAFETHDLVLCDRYADASLAYQGGGRGLDLAFVTQANHYATHGFVPDLTVLLDMTPEVSLERALKRIARSTGAAEDRFEKEEIAFHQRVRTTYLDLAKKEPARFLVVDAALPPKEIEGKLTVRIDTLLKESK
ncbi:MAG: dTMP kinase [Pseudomonadota bacterium]